MELSDLTVLINAITSSILVAYAGIQIFLMRKDVQEAKLQRSAATLLWVIETMEKLRDKRHHLYALPQNYRRWNLEQKELANDVGVRLEQVASLPEMGLIEEKYLLENYHGVFLKSWQKLEDYIKDYRKATDEPSQRIHLEQFAKKCANYRARFHRV